MAGSPIKTSSQAPSARVRKISSSGRKSSASAYQGNPFSLMAAHHHQQPGFGERIGPASNGAKARRRRPSPTCRNALALATLQLKGNSARRSSRVINYSIKAWHWHALISSSMKMLVWHERLNVSNVSASSCPKSQPKAQKRDAYQKIISGVAACWRLRRDKRTCNASAGNGPPTTGIWLMRRRRHHCAWQAKQAWRMARDRSNRQRRE